MLGNEMVQFAAALNEIFTVDQVTSLLQVLNRKFTDYTTANLPFPGQLEEVIGSANSQGWISQLVLEVVKQRPASVAIKNFLATYPNWDPSKSPHLAHPCEALRVFGGKSFIGRESLRKFLKAMSSGDSRNILLVTGEQQNVGKTYSKELVNFLSVKQPPSGFIYVDLDSEDYDAAKLTLAIAKGMRIDIAGMPAQGSEQASRWNQELSSWLVPDVPDPKHILWWIVLDGTRSRVLSEDVQDLIAQIGQRVQSTQDYRLILLDYANSLPLPVSGFMFRERVKPIQRDEVAQFLRQIHQQKYGSAPPKEKLSEYVAGAYEKLAEYVRLHPNMAQSHLLLNMAVTDASEIIREG